jgi:hypothetical protein
LLFGVASPELAGRVQSLSDRLAAAGVPTAVLSPEALDGNLDEFDEAGHLVLAFSDAGQPVKPFRFMTGGHLAAQRDAWLGKGRPADRLVWLDLREVVCPLPPGPGHTALVDAVAGSALTPAALKARFLPKAPPATSPPPPKAGERINIYIESNRHEHDLWEALGESLSKRWKALFPQILQRLPQQVPPPMLRCRGLPVDQIDSMPLLDDADGIVLLWGRKTSEALVAQISKVERKLPVLKTPPGIVAYLMPPQPQTSEPVPAWGWQVLRFDASDTDRIDVVEEESDQLDRFLLKVLGRWQHNEARSAP